MTIRERSRAYPGVSLQDCVAILKQLKRAFSSSVFNREHVADVLKVAVPTVTRSVAACAHFGLLGRAEGGYAVTQLGRIICDPLDNELKPALKQSFQTPALYREILDRYEPEGKVPERLATILHRSFGIAENAADLAATVFLKSAKFAGAIDDDFTFVDNGRDSTTNVPVQPVANAVSELQNPDNSSITIDSKTKSLSLDSTNFQLQEFRFRLSKDKFATLIVPATLDARDIALLRKQIELLELQLESD